MCVGGRGEAPRTKQGVAREQWGRSPAWTEPGPLLLGLSHNTSARQRARGGTPTSITIDLLRTLDVSSLEPG